MTRPAGVPIRLSVPRLPVPRVLRKYPVIPAAILIGLLVIAIVGPWLAPYDPVKVYLEDRHLGPFSVGEASGFHLLGTDESGRDILSRMLYGARNSVWLMFLALVLGIAVGVPLAMISGWYRGVTDEVVTRMVDIWQALPFLLVAIMVNQIFLSGSFLVLVLLLALNTWASYVRLIRAQILVVREKEFIDMARITGASSYWIIRKHLWPNVYGVFLIIATMNASNLILVESTLSFLGLGILQPNPSWGVMIRRATDYIAFAPHELLVPVGMIVVVTYAFNFLGDWLRDRAQYGDFVN